MPFVILIESNYLDIRGLLDLCCKNIANKIKGKQPEEVKEAFKIPVESIYYKPPATENGTAAINIAANSTAVTNGVSSTDTTTFTSVVTSIDTPPPTTPTAPMNVDHNSM